jgi:hypothetical protein
MAGIDIPAPLKPNMLIERVKVCNFRAGMSIPGIFFFDPKGRPGRFQQAGPHCCPPPALDTDPPTLST